MITVPWFIFALLLQMLMEKSYMWFTDFPRPPAPLALLQEVPHPQDAPLELEMWTVLSLALFLYPQSQWMQMRSRYKDKKKPSIYVCFTQGFIVKNYIGVISSIENMSYERKFYLHVPGICCKFRTWSKMFHFPNKI